MPIKAQKWPSNLVIIRHGESARNVAKDKARKIREAIYWAPDMGRDCDTPLTGRGQEQAQMAASYVRKSFHPVNTVFVSPFLRTVQTADPLIKLYIAEPTCPKVVIEERVREIEFGALDGLTAKGIREKYPEEWIRKQREGKYWYRAPGGENRPDLRLRIHSFLGALTRDYSGQNVIVYTHSVPVLVFRSLFERWDEKQYLAMDKETDVENCSVTAFKYDGEGGKMKLHCFNLCPWRDKE